MAKYLFTSESVTEGHPDKICDQISDAVLDSILEQDPNGRVACETTVTTGMVMVMGEISTSCYVDIPKIARQVIRDIGYDRAKFGFDCDTCGIITSIDEQSCDIAMGVDKGLEAKNANSEEEDNGAGDQGMMFGFACDDTPELMPMPISLAHKLAKQLAKVRKDGTLDYLRPDGKTQVTIEYENEVPVAVETIVISNQHSPEVEMEQLRADIKKYVIDPIVPQELMTEQTKLMAATLQYEVDCTEGTTQEGYLVLRPVTLTYQTASYAQSRQIIDALSASANVNFLSNVDVQYDADKAQYKTVLHLIFFELMP